MKKVQQPTPIHDKLNKTVIKHSLGIMHDCMAELLSSASEEIVDENNNYYVYKTNFEYVALLLKLLYSKQFDRLLSDDQKYIRDMNTFLVNSYSVELNESIKRFNNYEKKNKPFFNRARLKEFKLLKYRPIKERD